MTTTTIPLAVAADADEALREWTLRGCRTHHDARMVKLLCDRHPGPAAEQELQAAEKAAYALHIRELRRQDKLPYWRRDDGAEAMRLYRLWQVAAHRASQAPAQDIAQTGLREVAQAWIAQPESEVAWIDLRCYPFLPRRWQQAPE